MLSVVSFQYQQFEDLIFVMKLVTYSVHHFLFGLLCFFSGNLRSANAALQCPAEWTYYEPGGTCIFVETVSELDWQDAKENCEAHPSGVAASLIKIDNQAEQDFLAGLLNANTNYWIGLNDIAVEGTYEWTDGTSPNYENWENNEPSGGGEDCAHIWAGHGYKWNDHGCSTVKRHICEISESDPCEGNPCDNGGTCASTSYTDFTCTCPNGYYGTLCEIEPCDDSPCTNGGRCVPISATEFTCDCPDEFSGDLCDIPLEWALVFKVASGTGTDVHALWTDNALTTDTSEEAQNLTSSISYKSPLLENWETSLNVKKVKVSLYEQGTEVVYFTFNADGITDRKTWFSKGNLIDTSYTDLATQNSNAFSVDGSIADSNAPNRHFYISHIHAGCPGDEGWLAVIDVDGSDVCDWARQTNPPQFLYSSLSTYANWNTGNINKANMFAIYIGYEIIDPCDGSPCANGGTCVPTSATEFTCDCPPGFYGDICEINPCDGSPCANGGTCVPTSATDFSCDCPPGYYGDICEINPCDGSPCANGGTCVPTSATEFTCDCPDEFSGDLCDIPLEKSVVCTQDEIEVAIKVPSMPILPPWAYFDDHNCVGSFNGTHIVLTTGLNQCGTQMTFPTSDDIAYSNNVWYIDAESDGSIISRSGEVKLEVECLYPREEVLSVGSFTPHYDLFEANVKGFGEITFSMNMYQASDFAVPYAADDYPIDIQVGQSLYVEVSAYSSSPDLEILIASCKASASDNPLDTSLFNLPLIEAGCPAESTVSYIGSNTPFIKRFSFEAFVFLDRTDEVYLHCEVILCSASDPQSTCNLECTDQPSIQRRSSSRIDKVERNIISIGPLIETGTPRAALGREADQP